MSSNRSPIPLPLETKANVEDFIQHLHADFEAGRLSDCLPFFAIPCVVVDFANRDVEVFRDNPALMAYLSQYYQAFLASNVSSRMIKIVSLERRKNRRIKCEVYLEERDDEKQVVARSQICYTLAPSQATFLIELVEIFAPHPKIADLDTQLFSDD